MEDKVCSPETCSVTDSQEKETSRWTNEKHSLYLQSIEASFVDQLYNSLDMLSCQTQNTYSSDAISTWKNQPDTCIPSGHFKVIQRGSWSTKSFRRQNSHVKDAGRTRVSPANPWIQQFIDRSHKRPDSTATRLDHEPGCSNTEVMDQNFVEETPCSRKRVRASKIDHSIDDQVVPNCVSSATEMPDSYVSPNK